MYDMYITIHSLIYDVVDVCVYVVYRLSRHYSGGVTVTVFQDRCVSIYIIGLVDSQHEMRFM